MNIAAKIRSLECRTLWRFALVALGVVIFGALAVYPYIPTSGDSFSCWYNYIANWRHGGLALSLKKADATGRYPGYPFLLILIEDFFGVNFLNALLILRIFCLAGTFLAMVSFFRSVGNTLFAAVIFAATILLTPMCWMDIQLNSQDSVKVLFFILSIIFVNKYAEEPTGKRYWYALTIFFSVNLVCVRAPEGLPFYAYAWIYLTAKKHCLRGGIINFISVAAPSVLFVSLLHIYGKFITGHYALSGPNIPPDIWLKMSIAYIHSMKGSVIDKLFELIRLLGTVSLNKGGYFVEDYLFFASHSIRILDHKTFYTELQRVSIWRAVVIYPTLIAIFLGCIYLLKEKFKSQYVKPLLIAGLASAGFYTFGLNHYEPRYWLFVFVAPSMGVACAYGDSKKFLVGAIFVLFLLQLPRSLRQLVRYRNISHATLALADKWQAQAREMCRRNVQYVLIPVNDYEFTSYRYFAAQSCPKLKFLVAETAHLNGPEMKNAVILKPAEFEGAFIVGLDKNKLTF